MGRQIKAIYKKAESSFNNPEHQKKWQGGIGILVMVVFVLSSVLFNGTVQAVNLVAGNYGYYNNSYGYQITTSSDYVPAAVSDLAASSGNGKVTLTWTAVTSTTGGSSLDNFDTTTNGYKIFYATSSGSANSTSGTAWTSTNDSALLTQATTTTQVTGLTNGTTYYFAIYSHDTNTNNSLISNVASATPASVGGAVTGGGAPAQTISGTETPLVTVTPGAGTGLPGTTLVTTIIGNLDDGAAAALLAAGVDPNSTLGKQAIAIADAATDILLGKESTKDTAVQKEVREIFEGTLSVVIANLTEVQKGAKGETAGQRAAKAIQSVLGATFTDAQKDVAVATVLAEQLVVPALADGTVSDNLRREIMAALLAKGKTQAAADALNKKLEAREKAYGPIYLAFYDGVGPEGKKGTTVVEKLTAQETDARWGNFLAGAYGARVQEESRNFAAEKSAIARYDKVFTGKRDGAKLLGPIATLEKGGKLTQEQTQRAWNLVQQAAYASVQKPVIRLFSTI